VIESMVYSVPPIVTDTGGSAELVQHRQCGLVVRPGDAEALGRAMHELASDRERAAELGMRARTRIECHFNIRDTITRLLEVYEDALAD
jgi:glycosyltransferase involved in cell wall biosynthesis